MGALSGTAFGVAVGGISGTLIGLGLTELEAKRYETKLKAGNVLVSVHLDLPDQVQRVRDVFQRAGGEDISVSTEVKPAVALKT
jgi:D-serine deaminase-like pyridoxal phosphate-dependent protein